MNIKKKTFSPLEKADEYFYEDNVQTVKDAKKRWKESHTV